MLVHELDMSVIIPVYRSEETLPLLVARLVSTLQLMGLEYELILVDDCSPDGSWRVIRKLQAEHPDRIVALQLMRNFGQHNATMCGFRRSRSRFIVTLDDDLQISPEEIPRLLESLQVQNLDLVYGGYGSKKHEPWRNLGSWIINFFFQKTFNTNATITSCRIIRRELVECILSYNLNFTFIDGLLAWNTHRIGEIPVEHHPRKVGRSGYNLAKLLVLAFNLFTNFSLLPLQIISFTGFLFAMMGLLAAVYYIVLWLMREIAVPGYASIIIAVLVLGGIQLLALGMLGEYLGRLHMNVNRKPQYAVRTVLARDGCRGEPSEQVESDARDESRMRSGD